MIPWHWIPGPLLGLLRWIQTRSQLGRMEAKIDTLLERVEPAPAPAFPSRTPYYPPEDHSNVAPKSRAFGPWSGVTVIRDAGFDEADHQMKLRAQTETGRRRW